MDPAVESALPFVIFLMREGKIPTDLFLSHVWNFDSLPEAYAEMHSGRVIKGLVRIEK